MNANPIGLTARPIESPRQSNDYADCVLDDQINPSVDNDLGGAVPGRETMRCSSSPNKRPPSRRTTCSARRVSRGCSPITHMCAVERYLTAAMSLRNIECFRRWSWAIPLATSRAGACWRPTLSRRDVHSVHARRPTRHDCSGPFGLSWAGGRSRDPDHGQRRLGLPCCGDVGGGDHRRVSDTRCRGHSSRCCSRSRTGP